MSTPGDGRVGNLPVPAVAAFREVADGVVEAARRWRDPSARLRRKKRRARRRARIFGAASGMWGVGTATLVAASAPDWTIVATGGTTAALAVPAVLAVRTARRLDALPLPPAPPRRRALPPQGSVARAPMARLASNEQSLAQLLGVLARSQAVVAEDLDEIGEAAQAASSALEAVAVDVVALESAASGSAAAGAQLGPALAAAGRRLETGVDQFEELVAAAARFAGAPEGSRPMAVLEQQRAELISASDRLEGWAQSWQDVDRIQQRYRS
ncbi:phage shock envelope stress response protein PspM [Rhodococcus zopfii]|uniref:phage shock envelope stress response protein PspM n=1 Tax=Rhodococcus zopfii TaxID=43772 RepID=UPI0011113DE5|nr:hypothetical protein [Rhodococcus zopfii]